MSCQKELCIKKSSTPEETPIRTSSNAQVEMQPNFELTGLKVTFYMTKKGMGSDQKVNLSFTRHQNYFVINVAR